MAHHVSTFWYLDTDDPAAPIRSGLPSDPGFARRLLSKLFPTVTVASLGSFPLNRSASAGQGEIYIGSFPGLTVVQTPVEGSVLPSATGETWLRLVTAPTVLAFSHDPESGVSGFARWESGRLVRSFAGADDRIVEDEGIPLPFERPYWAGEFPLTGHDDDPLALPFAPESLLHAAHREWLGFDLAPGDLDVPVHGFATDGRREVRQHHTPNGAAHHVLGGPGRAELNAAARREAAADPAGDDRPGSPYEDDDYERTPFSRPRRGRAAPDGPARDVSAPGRSGGSALGGSGLGGSVFGAIRRAAGTVGGAVRRGAGAVSRRRPGDR